MIGWVDNTDEWVDNSTGWVGTGDITLDITDPATNTANGLFTEHWMYPPFYILDEDENYLQLINFEDVYPGRPTETKTLTIKNELPANVTLAITGGAVSGSGDTEKDTVGATYLSLDDTDYSHNISLPVNANSTADFYLYYRPPSTAKIGNKHWDLGLNFTANAFGWWSYINMFDVTSISTTDQTDVVISVTIPYTAGKMETDFSDIRFYHYNFRLESMIDYKVDSTSATFLVKIPILYADEVKTIWVLSGNSSIDYFNYKTYTEGWDWLDGTLNPWEETAYGYHSGTYVNADCFGHNAMYSMGSPIQTPPEAEVEATGVYGRWTMRYQFTTTYNNSHLARWTFINDGVDNYNIYIDNENQSITLYKNNTVLDTAFLASSVTPKILIITRDLTGTFTVSVDGTEYLEATDNTITTSIKENIWFNSTYGTRYWYIDYIHFVEHTDDYPTIGALDDWYDLAYGIGMMGKVGYDIQTLPEISNTLRYGIRIDGELYE